VRREVSRHVFSRFAASRGFPAALRIDSDEKRIQQQIAAKNSESQNRE